MLTICFFALTLGCGQKTVTESRALAASETVEDKTVVVKATDPLPPDLRSRKTGSDWPTFQGLNGASVSTEKGILRTWPKQGPRIVWEKPLGIGYSMPATSRGRLFLFDRVKDRARLRCMKSETAEHLWSFSYPTAYRDKYNYNGGPRCCPVVDGTRVYIFGAEGMLHCLRASDGKIVWKIDTAKAFGVVQNFFGVGSTPVIEGDLLLVQVGGSPKGSEDTPFEDLKGNGTGVVAFDKFTGKVKYKISTELASYASLVLATIDKRRWCFLLARGGLVGFEPSSGKIDFHFPWRASDLESVNASNPVVVGDKVFISECYGLGSALLKVKPNGVKEVWTDAGKPARRKSMRCHWMTPIHLDGYVYGSSGRHTPEAELRCVELATGKVMWSERKLTRSSLLLVDGHFICLSEDGVLRLLRVNPKKYDEVTSVVLRPQDKKGNAVPEGELLLEYPCWAAPLLSHGLLYVRGEGRLVCLELIPARKK
jgi:outer membrane protein assembly factor BamB